MSGWRHSVSPIPCTTRTSALGASRSTLSSSAGGGGSTAPAQPRETAGDDDGSRALGSHDEELPAWSFKLYAKHGTDYTVAVARSARWPGAYSAAMMKGDKMASVYIGYGTENTGKSFTPAPPPAILGEAPDAEEQDDVTLDAENALLKSIEEAKMVAEGEEPAEEE